MEVRDTLRFWALDRKAIKEFFQEELAILSGEVGADVTEMANYKKAPPPIIRTTAHHSRPLN